MFFELSNNDSKKQVNYHLEFQVKNDTSMVIRMFEYGFNKSKETAKKYSGYDEIKTLYFPKQKVIFFEENKNIEECLKLKIVFPNNQEYIYSVDVIKYWDFTDEELIKRKMYPLIPLQLFSLRKELEKARNKSNIERIKELSYIAKDLATKLATESKELLDKNEILSEDFHKMLLAIQNLIEYLNRNYINDKRIEKEVNTMTETLYNPEVEKRGIEKGIEIGMEKVIIELLKEAFTPEKIAKLIKVDLEKVLEVRNRYIN